MLPSASDLKYFIEVSSTGNLSRAAERLGISQPSLTLSIQRLEKEVGVDLLIRSKRGVALTPAGKRLLAQGRFLLQEWEKVREAATKSQSEVSGSYVLGCHPSVALYSLPHFMPELLEKFPDLEIKVSHDLSRKVTESVISMNLDLGIVVNPVQHPDLIIKKLCDDEVTFWTAPGSRSIQSPSSEAGVLICDPELLQTQDLIKKLGGSKEGFSYRRTLFSSNLEVISNLVASGSGYGILPGRVAKRVRNPKLKKIRGAPIFKDEICLVYRVENRKVRAIQEIADRIQGAFSLKGP